MSRVCAFCRQQQQQHITTTRSLHTSPAQQNSASSLPLAPSQSRGRRANHQNSIATTRQRPFSKSATIRKNDNDNGNNNTHNNSRQPPEPSGGPKAPPRTHYELFPKTLPSGPPPRGSFAIDVQALRREFLALQAGAHPDMHPAHRKAQAQATSARINEAFKTLADPLLRAQYVLSLRGLDVTSDERAEPADPTLLVLVMETREAVEAARNEDELERLRVLNEERIQVSKDRLAELFAADKLREAYGEAVRLRYWVNVRESIDEWEKPWEEGMLPVLER